MAPVTLSSHPAEMLGFTRAQDMEAFERMLMIRRLEEKIGQFYGLGLIGGYCHLYIGQEAVVTGMQMASAPGDQVITGYRDHAHALSCGVDPRKILAELTGRRGGLSKGKGGSMHLFAPDKNFFGGHGIVGAQVPLGTGLAFAAQRRGQGQVVICYLGDGAANQGQVYESFNMAQLWKLPVVYVIENNRYAMGTSIARSSAVTDLSRRGEAFDIPGERVDGMDVRAVHFAGARALARARAGQGPCVIEMQTYRYRGHSMADPAKYRSEAEVEKIRETRDPIEWVRERLMSGSNGGADALKALDARIRASVNAAAEYAQHEREAEPSELFADVLA